MYENLVEPGDDLSTVERIDDVAERFETAWKESPPASLREFVPSGSGRERSLILRELVQIDLEYRYRRGERRKPEDYLADFPDLAEGADGSLPDDLVRFAHRLSQEYEEASTWRWCPHCGAAIAPDANATEPASCRSCGSPIRSGGVHGETASPESASGLPKTVGKFQLVRVLGSGSFGVVYLARDCQLRRWVAIKVPQSGRFSTPQQRERFIREARSAAALDHANIVSVYEVLIEEGLPLIVSEYIEGEDLADRLARGCPDARQAARWVAQLADAVDYAHRRGVIHRDVNPRNVLIDTEGQLRVTDFGLALHRDAEATMTAQGQVLGAPAYMSPEQAEGRSHEVDACSDIYGLGAVLYALLTGHPPFRGGARQVLYDVLHVDPDPPRRLRRQIPRDLETICLKCLEKKPARRYQSAGELADRLRMFLEGRPIPDRQIGMWERLWRWTRRHPARAATILAVAVTLATVVGTQLAAANARAAHAVAQERQRRRDSLIEQMQRIRLTDRTSGWSDKVRRLAHQVAEIRRDEDLRDHMTAALVGLDARMAKRFRQFGGSSVAFDAEGRRLLVGGLDGGAKLWNPDTDEVTESELVGPGPVTFAADGAPLQLTAIDRWKLLLWNLETQQALRQFEFPGKRQPESPGPGRIPEMALAPGGRFVAASTTMSDGEGMVAVWNGSDGKLLIQGEVRARSLAFSADGRLLAAGDEAGRITVWFLPDQEPAAVLRAGRTQIEALAFHRSPRVTDAVESATQWREPWLLAAGDAGGTITIWDPAAKVPVAFCHGSHYHVLAVEFSPDGTLLAAGGRHEVRLWDVATGRFLLQLQTPPPQPPEIDYVTGLAFSPDGRQLAVSTEPAHVPGTVVVFDVEYGHGIVTLRGLASQVPKVVFSPEGRYLAALAHDWKVGIWDLSAGRLKWVIDVPKGYFADNAALAFSPDGSRFAFSAGTTAKRWNLVTGREEQTWKLPPGLQDVLAFHPSGKLLLIRFETRQAEQPPLSNAPPRDYPRVCRVRDLTADEYLKPLAEVSDFNSHVYELAAPRDGNFFVGRGIHSTADGKRRELLIKAFDPFTGKELWSSTTGGLAYDPRGPLAFVSLEPVTIVEVPSARLVGTLPFHFFALGPK